MLGIVALTARKEGKVVHFERSVSGVTEAFDASTWQEAAKWLTQYKNHLAVTFVLETFTNAVLSLLPREARAQLDRQPSVYVDGSKFFVTQQQFGIDYSVRDFNIKTTSTVNIYGLQTFLGRDYPVPTDVVDVEQAGIELLSILSTTFRLSPDKLTSPVGLLADKLRDAEVPTIWTNKHPLYVKACNYALKIGGAQWYQDFAPERGEIHTYDLVSAYPSVIRNLPDTDGCQVVYSETTAYKCDFAILKGTVEVTSPVTGIPSIAEDSWEFGKVGTWPTYITMDEVRWLHNRGLGHFKLDNGYFFKWHSQRHAYQPLVDDLFRIKRSETGVVSVLAKTMAAGISGKLDAIARDGKYGEFFNPILALIVRSTTRLKVASFIWDNGLQDSLVKVVLDGVSAKKKVDVPNSGEMGTWRMVE